MRDHAFRFAARDLFSIRITGVRHDLKPIYPKGSFCGLSHWTEATDVRCIEHDSVCHDQRSFSIDSSLDVISRESLLGY
jgi:hypothetical protein